MRSVRALVSRRLSSAGCVMVVVAGVVAVGAAPAAGAEPQILGAGSATAIDGSYVVVYKDSAARKATSAAASLGSKVTNTYSAVFPGFAAAMSEREAKRFAADPDVAFVEQNQRVGVADRQFATSWGQDRVDQRDLPLDIFYTNANNAENVHAYVIDTGIDLDNPEFGGRVTSGLDVIDSDFEAQDENGHGTVVAHILGGTDFGVAKGVSLVAVRVLDEFGFGTSAFVVDGVDWVEENAVKPAVANMSLSVGIVDPAINAAVSASINGGVTYVVASGNWSIDACGFSPASVPEAITVNASTVTDARASFSNYGDCTDIFAPGQDIPTPHPSGGLRISSGTSMAAPHVAGAAAMYLSAYPASAPWQVTSALLRVATPDRISDPGPGSPNRLLYTGPGLLEPPPAPPGGGPCPGVTNADDYPIADFSTVFSPVLVSGCTGNASDVSAVTVWIVHTFIADLAVELIAPDGSVYPLQVHDGGPTHNIGKTFTVDLSSETTDGLWNLRVRDLFPADTGYVDNWTLDL